MKSEQILTSPEITLTKDVLRGELGFLFPIYEELTATFKDPGFNITPEWRFYKDGNAWLCKMTRRKKTVFWISAWKSHLKAAFYFTAKSGEGIPDLEIDPSLKSAYMNATPIGKLFPLIIEIRSMKEIADLSTVAAYKIARK